MDRLKAENESLKLALSNAQNANKTALLSAEARFKEELKAVKSKAAWRIKDLMSQVKHTIFESLLFINIILRA